MKKKFFVPLKLTDEEKLIYIFDEIVSQEDEYGKHIPIRVIEKAFNKNPKTYNINTMDIRLIISKIEKAGVINFSKNKTIIGRI